MAARRGALILFEGVDRCGKTTQAKMLVDALVAEGKPSVFMRFPGAHSVYTSYCPNTATITPPHADRETGIGSIVNKYLSSELDADDHSIHLLFSSNRWEKLYVNSALRKLKIHNFPY
jgi:dTMP kinase